MFNKLKNVLLASSVSLFGVFQSASAALPAAAATAFTDITTDGLALIDLVWPVVVAITGGFILLKLFKKGISKAT